MPELMAVLEASRKKLHEDRKFSAAIQGIDIDKGSSSPGGATGEAMDRLRKKIAEKRAAKGQSPLDSGIPNDIASFKGQKAAEAGFGIGPGMGIDYEYID